MQLLKKVWKNQPGKYFCISTKDRFGKWEEHFFKKSEFDEIEEFLLDYSDRDLYWCPHGFVKPRRLKQYAEIPKMLWADLDHVNPRDLAEQELTPTIAWESSPNRYCGIWYIDEYMTEDLNKALTYFIGADKGGWDLTQVLRIPGTKNYKYPESPMVKMLWGDGEEYCVKDLKKILPKQIVEEVKKDGTDAKAIFKKYESKFNRFIRSELLKGKAKHGHRSEVLWKLAHGIMEAGCTTDEAFELLRASPWNKFKERRDGDKQLRRELDKILSQHLNISVDGKDTYNESSKDEDDEDIDDEKPYTFLELSMDEVEEEVMDWLWYPYLARGELTILEGDPGLGKSYLAQMIGAHFCDGKKLPSGKPKEIMGKVAYFDMENSPGTVTKKRLRNNDCKNLHNFFQETYTFSIEDDDTLEQVDIALRKLKPALVVFDTVNSYLSGKVDTYKASDVQQAFKNFIEIARRHNCAVLVLRHLTKSTKEKALYRGQGSIAFTGLARVVITVGTHPEEPETRVMAVTKINVTKAPLAMTFTIQALPNTLKEEDRSRFVWGEYVDLTSDEIVSMGSVQKGRGENTEEAELFLEQMLEAGPIPQTKVIRAAETRNIKFGTLQRAATSLGIVKESRGFGTRKEAMWKLPNQKQAPNKRAKESVIKEIKK